MKGTKNQSTEKILSVWKNITSNFINKNNKNIENISNNGTDAARDMSNTHTPFSRDLSGLNKEQAKELIDKMIDEKLERISHLELSEPKVDYKERELQRAKAAERINERRSKRKQKSAMPAETIVTAEGVYSDFRQTSIFDEIQPESFPFEPGQTIEPIEGQISIDALVTPEKEEASADIVQNSELSESEPFLKKAKNYFHKNSKSQQNSEPVGHFAEYSPTFDLKHITNACADEEEAGNEIQERLEAQAVPEPMQIEMADLSAEPSVDLTKPELESNSEDHSVNTSFDAAIDKVFVFYEKNKNRVVRAAHITYRKTAEVMNGKVKPAAAETGKRIGNVVIPLLQKAESRLELKKKTKTGLMVLGEKEKAASEKMYRLIDLIDRINEAIVYRLVSIRNKIVFFYNRSKEFAEIHRKKLLVGFGAGVALASVITMVIGSMTAYEYIYNGKILGVVKNQEDVYKTIDIIGDKLSYEYDAEITIDKNKDIRFNKVIAFNQDLDDKEDILNRLTYMRDMKANGHGIYIDGKCVAILDSKETADDILNQIENKYVVQDSNIEYKKIGFAENVEIKDVETKLGNIEKEENALDYIMTGAVAKKIHVVQSGETFSEIAKTYGLKQSELKVSNPDIVPEKLQIGQEICLNQIVPLLTVQTVEVAQYKEAIPYSITYENTGSLYKNEQTVKSRGTNGEKDVVAEIVRNNGIEVSRTEISAQILSEPVAQVVLVGTKEPPPLIGTGTFIYPIRGTLTSRYGYRWGRLHSGIDLAAPIGTHIKAADGGKVTFAGYNGSLGYMVEIDHGGGRVTWYGHCSKLLVKKGDKVYQGQHIANVGNTGRSTGPHVHFEVHINGKAKNPLSYL